MQQLTKNIKVSRLSVVCRRLRGAGRGGRWPNSASPSIHCAARVAHNWSRAVTGRAVDDPAPRKQNLRPRAPGPRTRARTYRTIS